MKRIAFILAAVLGGFVCCSKPAPAETPSDNIPQEPVETVDSTVRFNILGCEGIQEFEIGEVRTYKVDCFGITRVQKSVAQGWDASFDASAGLLTISAPVQTANAEEDGRIEFIAKGTGGEMFTPSIEVHLNGIISLYLYGKGAEGTDESTAFAMRAARDEEEKEIEGCHEVFLDISPDIFRVKDSEGRNYVLNPDGSVTEGDGTSLLPEGLCRLRVNLVSGTWERIGINAVRYRQTGFPAMETPAEYLGRGCWLLRNAPLAERDGTYDLRYRFEVETSDPEALSYWCATWDEGTSRPTTYELNYQYIRQAGSGFDTADGERGYWYFMDSDKGKWANITICMNTDGSREDYTHKIALKTFADTPVCAFMGDSITARWGRENTGHPSFFTENTFLNAGISGQTTSQMLARFNADIVQFSPLAVVICAGTNDIARNQGYISNEDIMKNIAAMCGMAAEAGIRVILCSLLPADRYNWSPDVEPAELIRDMNVRIRAYAEAEGYPFVDFWTPFADEGYGLPEEYSSDGVHPNQACYTIMEEIILPVIQQTINDIQ